VGKKKKKKIKEKASIFWSEKNSTKMSFAGYVLIFSIVFLLIPLWEFLSNWHDFKGTYLFDRDKLSTRPGVILSSTTYISPGRKRKTYYHYSIEYEFEYNGKRYASDEVTFDDNYRLDPDFPEIYLDRYKEGKPVTVYFDPHNPSFSVLEPNNINERFDFLWIFVFLSLIGFYVFGCMLLIRKYLS